MGIPVDHRRHNRSLEGLQANVQRLKEYRSRLIVFPKKAGKTKMGDSDVSVSCTSPMCPVGARLIAGGGSGESQLG